jgi:hypothetical protein
VVVVVGAPAWWWWSLSVCFFGGGSLFHMSGLLEAGQQFNRAGKVIDRSIDRSSESRPSVNSIMGEKALIKSIEKKTPSPES